MGSLTDRHGTIRIALLFEGGLGVLAFLLAWSFGIPLASRMSVDARQILWGLVASGPMLVAFWSIRHTRRRSLRRIHRLVEWLARELFPTGSLVLIAIVSLLAGFGEEALFRGVLQPLAGRWTTPWVGLVVVSILFGLAHCLSWLYFILAALIGLYFGILANTFDSVTVPAVTHSFYDFIVLAYVTRESRKVKKSKVEEIPL